MTVLQTLFGGTDIASALIFICLTAFTGILLGKLEIKKIKLGIAGVLFTGLLIAHLGAHPDGETLHFVREFGLILFVYAIGIDVGPRFLPSLKKDGLKLNLFAIGIVFGGFTIAFCFYAFCGVKPEIITGIMSGAVTNTPGLGAAQQALREAGKPELTSVVGMAYAVAYPFGVIGIILAMLLLRKLFGISVNNEVEEYHKQFLTTNKLAGIRIHVSNKDVIGKKISLIRNEINADFVFSRIERNGKTLIVGNEETIHENDIIHGVCEKAHIASLESRLGTVSVATKQHISGDFAMFHVLVTNRKFAGKTIEQIGINERYEANITRIFRSGIEILATPEMNVELGDTVRIVGKRDILTDVRNELGNSVKELAHPNTIPIFMGIFLGIILGSIPIGIPGLSAPAKLGMAGGPLVIAIILGHKGRIGKLDFYMTPGANMMIRELGITLFLSCVGLSSGAQFAETISHGGYVWMLYGAAITFIPLMIAGIIARMRKYNYLKICGIMAGAMTDPPALEFANSIAPVQAQSTAYATVYPLTMFLRILLAQALILITL